MGKLVIWSTPGKLVIWRTPGKLVILRTPSKMAALCEVTSDLASFFVSITWSPIS